MSKNTTTDQTDVPTDESTAGSTTLTAGEQRAIVRERYASIASDTSDESGCCTDSCCGDDTVHTDATRLGYSQTDVEVTAGAQMSLGCGNPKAIASLSAGETVLDLGSGGGFDCSLASREVGEGGHVIGVDMTPEMIEKARKNARENDLSNVEFRLGEIEHLPVGDERVDVIISNCVVNLSPDKPHVFREAYRVLRPGGRLAISDVILTASPPEEVRNDPDLLAGCVSGAATIEALETMLANTGFEDVRIEPKSESASFIREWDDERDVSEYIVSATIEGVKPSKGGGKDDER